MCLLDRIMDTVDLKWLVERRDSQPSIFTFIMSACQMIGPGYIMYVCLRVDAVQVLSPGVWVQGSEKLLHSVEGSDGPVQILQREGNLCGRDWNLPSSAVLQRAKVKKVKWSIPLLFYAYSNVSSWSFIAVYGNIREITGKCSRTSVSHFLILSPFLWRTKLHDLNWKKVTGEPVE